METELWTEKYRPKSYSDFIGGSANIKNIQKWFQDFRDGKNTKKILLFVGDSGVGKTSMAYIAMREEGYQCVEYNSVNIPDNKSMKEIVTKSLGNANILELFNGKMTPTGIIFDEIDNLSSGLTEFISMVKSDDKQTSKPDKKSSAPVSRAGNIIQAPIICTCNNLASRGLKGLLPFCEQIKFGTPNKFELEQLIQKITQAEGMDLEIDAYHIIIQKCQNDWRSLIGMLQGLKLRYANIINEDGSTQVVNLDIEKVKSGVEHLDHKDLDLTIYEIISQIFNKKLSVDECEKMFVTDSSMIPLLIQQNYHKVAIAKKESSQDLLNKLSKISNYMMEYDQITTTIYQSQEWQLTKYMSLYAASHVNYELNYETTKKGQFFEIDSSALLNKISQHRRNIKHMTNLPILLETNLEYVDLFILSEFIFYHLFDKNGQLEFVIKILLNNGFDLEVENVFNVDLISNILSLNPNKTKKITTKLKNDLQSIYQELISKPPNVVST